MGLSASNEILFLAQQKSVLNFTTKPKFKICTDAVKFMMFIPFKYCRNTDKSGVHKETKIKEQILEILPTILQMTALFPPFLI